MATTRPNNLDEAPWRAANTLRGLEHKIFMLKRVEDLTTAQIAERLQMPVDEVMAILTSAIVHFTEALARERGGT